MSTSDVCLCLLLMFWMRGRGDVCPRSGFRTDCYTLCDGVVCLCSGKCHLHRGLPVFIELRVRTHSLSKRKSDREGTIR